MAPHAASDTFGWMVAPFTKEHFFEHYYEQKYLHIERNDPGYYTDLLSLDSLSSLMYSQVLRYPDVRMVNSRKDDIKSEEYTGQSSRIRVEKVLSYFAEGATVIFSMLHDYLPSLGLFIDSLASELQQRFQTNIYLTPPNAQGFKVHFDTHDVFILQTEGSKVWKLYDTPIALPLKSQEYKAESFEPGEMTAEITLRKGDMLYIPRGLMHEAVATDECSMHITTGLIGYTWTELVVETMLRLSKEHVELRRNLLLALHSAQPAEEVLRQLDAIKEIISNGFDLNRSAKNFRDELLNLQKPNIKSAFQTVLRLPSITADTEVLVRESIMFDVQESEEKAVVELLGNEVEFPAFVLPILTFLQENVGTPFAIKNLPDCMDEAGKLVLVKRLIREGLIALAEMEVPVKSPQLSF